MNWSLDQWRRCIGGWSGGCCLCVCGGSGCDSGEESVNQIFLSLCILLWFTVFAAFVTLVRPSIISVVWSCLHWWINAVVWLCSQWWIIQQLCRAPKSCSVILFLLLLRYASADDFESGQSVAESTSFVAVASTFAASAARGANRVARRIALMPITNQSSRCCSHQHSKPESNSNAKRTSSSSSGGRGGTKKRKQNRKKARFTPTTFKAFYKMLLDEAEKIPPSEHPGHTSLLEILRCDKMKALIAAIHTVTKSNGNSLFNKAMKEDLRVVEMMFEEVGVNIHDFRDDIRDTFDENGVLVPGRFRKECLSLFLKRMLCYTLRFKQSGCACCGTLIGINTLFGALGFESNHWLDDKDSNGGSDGSKRFNLSADNFGRPVEDLLLEFVKTRLECWMCHNKYGPDLYDSLPTECYGNYSFTIQPFCAVQKESQCRKLIKCIKELLDGDIASYTFEYVKDAIETRTDFDIRDVATFDEVSWDALLRRGREQKLMRLYLQAEKRMSGGCYFCKKRFDNKPLACYPGLHGHHLVPEKKEMNPSEGASKSVVDKVRKRLLACGLDLSWIGTARREHKKTFPLCLQCHMFVTHDEEKNFEFEAMVKADGWIVDDDTGLVHDGSKGLYLSGFRLLRDVGVIDVDVVV